MILNDLSLALNADLSRAVYRFFSCTIILQETQEQAREQEPIVRVSPTPSNYNTFSSEDDNETDDEDDEGIFSFSTEDYCVWLTEVMLTLISRKASLFLFD